MTDLTASARKALNLSGVSPWIAKSLAGGPIVGLCAEAITKLVAPVAAATVGPVGFVAWGLAVCFSVGWVWRRKSGAYKRTSQVDHAREWIQAMKLAMDAADYPKAQQRVIWTDIFRKLAQDFKVGDGGQRLPAPADMLAAVKPPEGTT